MVSTHTHTSTRARAHTHTQARTHRFIVLPLIMASITNSFLATCNDMLSIIRHVFKRSYFPILRDSPAN